MSTPFLCRTWSSASALAPLILLCLSAACEPPGEVLRQDAATLGVSWKASDDTYVKDSAPSSSFGNATALCADSSPETKRSLLRFAVNGIPEGAVIRSATLWLYVINNSGAASGESGTVHQVVGNWSETTTWNTRPAVGSKVADLVDPARSGTWTTANVSAAVTGNGLVNFYITTSSSDGVDYASSEASNKPTLDVIYDLPSAVDAGAVDGGSTDAGVGPPAGDAGTPVADAGAPVVDAGFTPSPLDRLVVIDQGRMTAEELVTMQTLQGVLAQTDPRVWISGGTPGAVFLADLQARHSVATETSTAPWDVVRRFAADLKGFILYDATRPSSRSAAVSLSGPMKAIAVDAALRSQALGAGLTQLMDVSARDERWALATYGDDPSFFGRGTFIELEDSKSGHLMDLAASRRAFTFWDGPSSTFRTEVAQKLGPHALCFGWGEAELAWVTGLSAGNAGGIAADYSRNLSVLQWVREPSLAQRTHHRMAAQDGVHYVSFVMSDGDNLQWLMRDFLKPAWFGSPYRGTFNMTWEMAPVLGEVAPSILRYYQLAASTREGARDFFVAGPSGRGYMLPSKYPDLSGYVQRQGPLLSSTDTRIVTVINAPTSTSTAGGMDSCDPILASPDVDAVLYKDFSNYAGMKGAIRWHQGKPCVAFKYRLWEGMSESASTPTGIASALTNAPRHPLTDSASYSLVVVHAWSSWGGAGAMGAVQQTISKLPPEVRVVTAEELVAMMRQQFGSPMPE